MIMYHLPLCSIFIFFMCDIIIYLTQDQRTCIQYYLIQHISVLLNILLTVSLCGKYIKYCNCEYSMNMLYKYYIFV